MLAAAPVELSGRDDVPLGPVELSRRLGVTTAASTQAVDRLERRGHLQRVRHARDGRRRTLAATDSGRAHVMSQLGPLLAALSAVAEEFTEQEQQTVVRYLRRAAAVMEEFAQDAASEDTAPPAR